RGIGNTRNKRPDACCGSSGLSRSAERAHSRLWDDRQVPPEPLLPRAWRVVITVWATLAATLVIALGIALHDKQATTFDTSVAHKLTEHVGDRLGSVLLGLSSQGLSIGVLAMVVVGALLARSWPLALLAIVGPVLALGVTEEVLKPLVHRVISVPVPGGVPVQA